MRDVEVVEDDASAVSSMELEPAPPRSETKDEDAFLAAGASPLVLSSAAVDPLLDPSCCCCCCCMALRTSACVSTLNPSGSAKVLCCTFSLPVSSPVPIPAVVDRWSTPSANKAKLHFPPAQVGHVHVRLASARFRRSSDETLSAPIPTAASC